MPDLKLVVSISNGSLELKVLFFYQHKQSEKLISCAC